MEKGHRQKESDRKRKSLQKASSRKSRSIKEKIKSVKESKIGLSTTFLCSFLKKCPNFIGAFAQDKLENLVIDKIPVSFIVNLDLSNKSGTHWIAVNVTNNSVEVWDSLALPKSFLKKNGKYLLTFLKQFKTGRSFLTCQKIQPDLSHLCGFYCIFFLIYRQTHSFEECKLYFTDITKNDDHLTKFLCSLWQNILFYFTVFILLIFYSVHKLVFFLFCQNI